MGKVRGTNWRPVETAPRQAGCWILVVVAHPEMKPVVRVGHYLNSGVWGVVPGGPLLPGQYVTHWQPLPKPPQVTQRMIGVAREWERAHHDGQDHPQ